MTILYQSPIMVFTPFAVRSMAILLTITILTVWLGVLLEPGIDKYFFGTSLITVTFLILALFYFSHNMIPSGRNSYKVILEKDYDVNQLYEKYNVIGQTGLIWELEDK